MPARKKESRTPANQYEVGTSSNGQIDRRRDFRMMTDMSKSARLPWDTIMTAERPRAYKPEVRMYLQAAQMLNLEPHEVMMCAAHLLDLKAAAVGGLRTAFIARPNEYGAPPNKYYTAETEAGPGVDFASTSVIDLAEQLGA